jgi:hypothetical protein
MNVVGMDYTCSHSLQIQDAGYNLFSKSEHLKQGLLLAFHNSKVLLDSLNLSRSVQHQISQRVTAY